MPISYQERTEEEYRRRASVMIQNFEGYRAGPYDAGDNMATIGFGYTFNRSNNLELWDRAGVQLSQTERQQLAAIDRAPDERKTELGLAFGVQITREEARSLLENASLSRYERPASNLNMPFSDERATVVSITYNRGPGRMATHMQGFNDAITDGDRAEAWYQMRYNSFGTAAIGTNNELGLRARRNMESQIFGLYDDPLNVTPEEARNVYRMFQLHRDDILENERSWGVDLDGNQARRSAIAQANNNYPDLVREYGQVQTLASALEPARNRLLEELRTENPELADRLRNENFATTAIYLDPGRELRAGNNLRPDQRNNTSQDVDENHAATMDSRRMRGNIEIESNDLLVGGGGGDTLRSHRGDDLLIGGQGRDRMEGGHGHDTYVIGAGDTLLDSDGVGEVRWGSQRLTGGVRSATDPGNTYRSEDGRFTYTLEGGNLAITDNLAADQALRERAVIENFQNGQLGIDLTGPTRGVQAFQLPTDLRDKAHPGNAVFQRTLGEVHRMEDARGIPHGPHSEQVAAALLVEAGRNRQSITNVEMGKDGQVHGIERHSVYEPEKRVEVNAQQALSRTMEQYATQWAQDRSPHYRSSTPAVQRTVEQEQALTLLPSRDKQMFDRIRGATPAHISDDTVASALYSAKKNGVDDANKIAGVGMIGDRLVVNGTTPGFRGEVDVSQPAPSLQETAQQTLAFNQQQALTQQQEEALRQQRGQDAAVRMV